LIARTMWSPLTSNYYLPVLLYGKHIITT
jgi:hypothetical protein